MPEDAAGRGRPRPRTRRGPDPQQGSVAERTSPGCRGRGGAPAPRSPPGQQEERPLPVSGSRLWLRRRPRRAGPRLAGREPAGTKGEGRGGQPRSQGPNQAGQAGCGSSRRQRPVSHSRRCPLRAAAETAGTGPREEPQPERRAAEAEEGRGQRVVDPLTRKQLWPRRRALRDRIDSPRPAARNPREESLASASLWDCAGLVARGATAGGAKAPRPRRPRGGLFGLAGPAQPLRPQYPGWKCEFKAAPALVTSNCQGDSSKGRNEGGWVWLKC